MPPIGTVKIFSPLSRVPTCLSKNSVNVPTFKLTWKYFNFACKGNIRLITDILPFQLDSSLVNNVVLL